MRHGGGVFGPERFESGDDFFHRFIPRNIRFHALHHRDIGVVVVDFLELQHAAAEFEILEKRSEVGADGRDEVVVDRHRHIIREKRGLAGGGMIAGAGIENIGANGIRQAGGEGELVVRKLAVELVECRLAHGGIALLEEGRERTLRQLALIALSVLQHAELHVHIRELGESLGVTAHRGGAEREEAFLTRSERMRFVAAEFLERGRPIDQRGVGEEFGKAIVGDLLDFGRDEGKGLTDFDEQTVEFRLAGKCGGVRTIPRRGEGGVLVELIDKLIDGFLEFEALGQRGR